MREFCNKLFKKVIDFMPANICVIITLDLCLTNMMNSAKQQ